MPRFNSMLVDGDSPWQDVWQVYYEELAKLRQWPHSSGRSTPDSHFYDVAVAVSTRLKPARYEELVYPEEPLTA